MPNLVMARSSARITVPDAQSITVFTQDSADVSRDVSGVVTLLGTVTGGQQTFGPFAGGATIIIAAANYLTMYGIGDAPVLRETIHYIIQRAPIALDTAQAIPVRALVNGVITSNSLLGITCTLPTGAALDAISDFRMDDAFEWCVIAAGLFGFTVGASAGHTIVGAAGVGSGTSGYFRTRKTGANAFITYRVS